MDAEQKGNRDGNQKSGVEKGSKAGEVEDHEGVEGGDRKGGWDRGLQGGVNCDELGQELSLLNCSHQSFEGDVVAHLSSEETSIFIVSTSTPQTTTKTSP